MLSVDRRSVHRWQASHLSNGIDALAAQPVPGRLGKLDDENRCRCEKSLLKGAVAAGFPTDIWTCRRVVDLICSEFGVRYHVGRLPRGLGWSPQKPERRARERNEERILGWIKHDWPRVKNAWRLRASLAFLDESGLLMSPLVRPT